MAFEPPPPGGSNFIPGGSNFQAPPAAPTGVPTVGSNVPIGGGAGGAVGHGGGGGGGPPNPTPTPSAPPPPDPGLTRVVLLATEAIRLDQSGKYNEAIQSYVYALEELLSLCRSETDIVKKNAYKSRAYTYMNRAEQLKKILRQRAARIRQQHSTKRRQAWADATFGKLLVRDVEGGEAQPTAYLSGGPLVCLFFGAGYCVKSQELMPKLLELYGRVRAAGIKLKIVFCSQDRDQASFDRFYGMQPWSALAYEERRTLGMVKGKYSVHTIPTVVVIKVSDGTTAVRDAAPQITRDASLNTWNAWMQHLPEAVQEQYKPKSQPESPGNTAGAGGPATASASAGAAAGGAAAGGAAAGGTVTFSVGERIEARSKGQSHLWLAGRVLTAHPTGQFDILFDDGHTDRYIPAMSVKAFTSSHDTYFLGSLIEARYKGQDQWWPAKVTRVLKSGKYNLLYEKGKRENAVLPSMMRLRPMPGP